MARQIRRAIQPADRRCRMARSGTTRAPTTATASSAISAAQGAFSL